MDDINKSELKNKTWKEFEKIYSQADKQDSYKMLIAEYWDARQIVEKYTDGTINNFYEWLVYKNYRDELSIVILNRILIENKYMKEVLNEI